MSKQTDDFFKSVVSHAKEYGFVFQSSEIYDGLSAVYDYGQLGSELKNNLKTYWWKSMVQLHENIVGIDAAIFMHPTTWKASGHVDGFNDPMIDNKDSKKRYRADQLIEDKIARYEADGKTAEAVALLDALNTALNADDLAGLKTIIEEHNIVCPVSGTKNWTEVRQFNLMFATQMGAMADGADQVYLRPETAQGIFVNFLNVQKTGRMKIPFGIAQIGKAFRNEVIARQFIMRMREFEQMEMQFFCRPGTELEWYNKWKETRLKWHLALGFDPSNYRYHDHDKLAHYANAAVDIEFNFPFGFKEVEGIHSRTDFDLKQHQEFSKKKMQYFDPEINQNYIPYVIETSIGLDRLFLTVLCNSLVTEDLSTAEKQDSRVVLKFPPALAPVKAAILPLTKKDGLPEKAREILNTLKLDYNVQYDEKDAIGKRYRRQDAIGTPICITVDYDSLEDNTVTIRHRDTMAQERVAIADLEKILNDLAGWNTLLKKLI
ncbi:MULTISPECIES: glycine--tRNA ligase [Sphingobacterium]|jgi:glycyl-tRNA synthetase|uniref:Glycine--tRNA ligase n=1 Tax=Sphingobacterium multivorum TaxID=28454 RepID=A0A654ACX6_SPHMU|nr:MULTISPECIES: glycine--tRNA ligase [Sphingobacterium]HAE67282.1 glycine--tRNA ligase [Sphingobacterium sp.]OFV09124.1 glycine--tRNA ligase [Sphingobacterium sp. HMSC13C05]QQT42961.1 glycine--tRNA ligase [Sphingobacterium multivorum]SUJ01318.1 Glycine--tRNA ligase [Sphingobacterium multivorum]VXC65666.1 Glycine--tRNA ligase [Sphingobacterium multivorum]